MNIRLAKAKAFGLSTVILYSNFVIFFTVTLAFRSIDLESTPGVNANDAIYGAWLIAWH